MTGIKEKASGSTAIAVSDAQRIQREGKSPAKHGTGKEKDRSLVARRRVKKKKKKVCSRGGLTLRRGGTAQTLQQAQRVTIAS